MEIDLIHARALYYRLWHYLVVFVHDEELFGELSALVAHLKDYPFNAQTAQAWQEIESFLGQGLEALKSEQNAVLFAPGEQFVPLSASYYLEGQDNGKKRLEAIALLKQSGLHIESHTIGAPVAEDDLAFLTLMMNAFLKEMLANPHFFALHATLFKDFFHLFSDAFIETIITHKSSVCYKNCAIILSAFIQHERLFFNLA
ncbi:Putative formate dehydrogenase-specific chaperone [Helicobacter heilmannii]|uniref:TorD/DmsD family molecular chaperone n=1 Tax=Helicobacter heilmannii TaxID=35817 RepID=UPI0006A07773|nr:molecular chaperone TorD family protein [Helicobacter heilmannii]CRF50524.1 Putative formate dehydrogenase-specific chaperone [Helicobacter heilmannii]